MQSVITVLSARHDILQIIFESNNRILLGSLIHSVLQYKQLTCNCLWAYAYLKKNTGKKTLENEIHPCIICSNLYWNWPRNGVKGLCGVFKCNSHLPFLSNCRERTNLMSFVFFVVKHRCNTTYFHLWRKTYVLWIFTQYKFAYFTLGLGSGGGKKASP